MSNSSDPAPPSPSQETNSLPPNRPRRHWLSWLLKAGAGLGVVVLAGGVVFVIWGDYIVTTYILPRIEVALEDTFDRQVKLGEAQDTSLWGVRLGETVVPPTEEDESHVVVESVEVELGLRSLFLQQTIKPSIILIEPKVSLIQAEDGTWGDLSLPEVSEEEPRVKLELQSVEVKNASLTAKPYTKEANAIVERETMEIDAVNGTLEIYGGENADELTFDVAGDVAEGEFDINGAANLEDKAIKANIRGTDLDATDANPFLPDDFGLSSGQLNANLSVVAALTEDNKLDEDITEIKGTARFREGVFLAEALSKPVSNITSQLVFKGQSVSLEDTSLQLDDIALIAYGDVDIKDGYSLTAQIPDVTLTDVEAVAEVDLPDNLAGTFNVATQVTGELTNPFIQGQLTNVNTLQVDQLNIATLTADFSVPLPEFSLTEVNLAELRVVPQEGGAITAGGRLDLTNLNDPRFQLTAQASGLPADAFARTYDITVPEEIVVGNLSADIEAFGDFQTQNASVLWQLADSTFPGSGEITLADDIAVLQNTRLQVAEGVVNAEAVLDINNGEWQAAVNTEQVPVGQFTNQAEGQLSADIVASGNLNALDLEQIQAKGSAAIANTRLYIDDTRTPLLEPGLWTTDFIWQEDTIAVQSFNAPSIQANGTIGIDLSQQIPIDGFNLDVALQSFDLQPLNRYLPSTATEYASLSGLTSFNGQLFGTLQTPQLKGNASIESLAVNQLAFETLSGPVALTPTDVNVNLQGQQDKLQLVANGSLQENLRQRRWPKLSFEVQNQSFVAEGHGQGRQLHADIIQLPLERLNVRPVSQYGFGEVEGLLDATVDINLASFSNPIADGTLTITDPSLNPVEADEFTATFAFADNTATLSQGELLLNDSRYLLTGSANLANAIQYQGQLTIADGHIEDLVPIVQKLDLSTFGIGDASDASGSAANLVTNPVGLSPNDTFLEKLEAFATFVQTHPPEESNPGDFVIPEIEELAGEFTGTIEVAGRSLAIADLTADVSIQGNSWTWGTYAAPNEFLISGNVQENSFDIESAFVSAGETQVDISGNGNLNQLTGQVVVENLPVELAQLIYPLPVDIGGNLNLTTTLSGNLANPTARGEATIVNTQLNNYNIEAVATQFIYRNAVLSVDSQVAVLPNESVTNHSLFSIFPPDSSPSELSLLDSMLSGNTSPLIGDASQPTTLSQQPVVAVSLTQPPSSLPPLTASAPSSQSRYKTLISQTPDDIITLQGTIPYALSFMQVQPPTNQLALTATVPNNSFEIINAFTDGQVQWESGTGQVVVNVGGTLQEPLVAGEARFQDGTISSPLLNNALTNLNGNVQFDLAQVNIEQLQASMGEGRVNITGQLPLLSSGQSILTQTQFISQAKQAPQNGLLVTLERLPVSYSNILAAVFDGQVLVSGAVLAPTASGNIVINDGEIQANRLLAEAGSISLPTPEEIEDTSPYRVAYLGDAAFEAPLTENLNREQSLSSALLKQIKLQDFDLTFGDRLAIVGTPFYNITAIGGLAVNGSLANLQPLGTIELQSGWINLFSTRFRLDSGAANTATFTPETGLNPYIDVVMTARVQDTDITPAPPSAGGFLNAEVNESIIDTVGSVDYINVQAIAEGPASELSDALTLTSNSSRSQGELLALVGSGVFTDLTSASYTQLAEYVGGGALTGFGDRIAEAVGLDSFRVFPTTDPDADSDSIGIGIEASASIGDRIGINILEILNSNTPPRLGVEYRISDQLNLNSTSNLDRTEFELEYRIEF